MPENTIPVLAKCGDPLEREICRYEDALRIVLQPYSEVWFRHVLVRRTPDRSAVAPEWMNFAGSHYTAITRIYHAYESLNDLRELSIAEIPEQEIGRHLLGVHRHWASYWENIGSAIDNLAMAFEDSQPCIIKEEARRELMAKYPEIEYAYNRRTQFIHSRLVPAYVREGILQARVRTTERAYRHLEPKESRWDLPYDSELTLDEILPSDWERFLNGMNNAWHWLLDELRKRDEGGVSLMQVNFPEMSPLQIQDTIVNFLGEESLISNVEFRGRTEVGNTPVQIPEFVFPPAPSGDVGR